MEILKSFFNNPALFDGLLLGVPQTGIFSKNELKQFKTEYGNSKLFELDTHQLRTLIDENARKTGVQFDNGWVYGDRNTFSQKTLPSHWFYVHFSNKIYMSDGIEGSDTYFIGFFVSRTTICSFVEVIDLVTRYKIIIPHVIYHNGKWLHKTDTRSSVSSAILFAIDMINSYQTVIVDRTTEPKYNIKCQLWNKKKLVKTPSAYYKVSLKDKIIIEEDESETDTVCVRREKTFAYFVRGCDTHRIKTGNLPIDPVIEKQLRKDSRRKIFMSINELDEESKEILENRQIRMKEGQWVSILKTKRTSYIANSKDGKNPYIPSVHTNVTK